MTKNSREQERIDTLKDFEYHKKHTVLLNLIISWWESEGKFKNSKDPEFITAAKKIFIGSSLMTYAELISRIKGIHNK